MNDGSISFATTLDNEPLDKALKQAEGKIRSLKSKLEDQGAEKSFVEKKLEAAQKALDETADKMAPAVEEYKQLLSQLDADPSLADDSAFQASVESFRARSEALTQQYAEQEKVVAALTARNEKLGESMELNTEKLARAEAKYAELSAEQASSAAYEKRATAFNALQDKMKDSAKGAAAAIRNAHEKGANMAASTYQRVGQVMRSAFANIVPVASLMAVFTLLSNKVKEFVGQNEQAASAINGMKAAINGFASGLASIFLPAILGFVRVITTMLMTLARLIDSIFKTDFVGHIRAQVAAAASSGEAAEATERQADSTDRLAKSLKEANRQLMSFDELNVLNADQAEDNADAMGDVPEDSGADAGGGFEPAALLEGIDAALAQIMLIAGAMILAVGIILTVSGANIPLGLALIAIGALMVYTAVEEQWDKLPEETRNTLMSILMVIGAALIVVGIILCATGNIPLGIAFVVAGAAMFVTAAAIDPEFMKSQVAETILSILTVVAGALIVVGVILCVMGMVPLGIAFIAAGALLFVTVATLNPDVIENMVAGFKDHVLGIIGGALLVIGIVLCIAGVALPLGIALIAAGSVMLVGELVLLWDKMPEEMREFVSTAMKIIGGALIVIGVMLCITGNIPLGIAAIIVGIVVFVTEEALNENITREKMEAFFTDAIPIIAGALVVIGVLLMLTGVGIALGIAAIIAGIAVLSVAEEELNEEYIPDEVEKFMDGLLDFIRQNAGYLLVLGILLVLTGVMLPLGVGLIVAGLVGMVLPEEVDFNAIKDKIREVWDGIVSWWNSNVANIFTLEWWQNLFSCIGEGIWNALTSVGGMFGGFFGDLAQGVVDIAGGLGISMSLPIPQFDIPFLASGAVIPPNKRFMAVLGDQANGTNLEAPEALIRQIVREESGGGNTDLLGQILDAIREGKDIYMDGDKVGSTVLAYQSSMQRVNGW